MKVDQTMKYFADIFFMRTPLLSIPEGMRCPHKYGSLSGYKMNENNPEAMMVSEIWLTQLNEAVSFHWTKQGFINVGINITANPVTQMFPANYRPGQVSQPNKK